MDTEPKYIYVLSEYNWLPCILLKTNKTTYKVRMLNHPNERNFKKEKCAFPDEEVCIVWETWKGKNGRGGYRVERNLYPQSRIPAKLIARQSNGPGRITE